VKKPKLEEFMILENSKGEQGVLIEHDSESYPWWICYGNSGQVFSESEDDEDYQNISKIYKSIRNGHIKYDALRFMKDGSTLEYNCVYDKNKVEEKVVDEIEDKFKKCGVEVKYINGGYKPFNIVLEKLKEQWNNGKAKEILEAIIDK